MHKLILRHRTSLQTLAIPCVMTCMSLLTIAGCGASRPKSLTTRETEALGRGRLIGAPIADYIEMLGKPNRVFMCRHRDSVLGVRGWVAIPHGQMNDWVDNTVKTGFQERECLLIGEIRLKLDTNRTSPILAAALIAAGAGVYAITEDILGYQQLRAVEGASSPLGLTSQDDEEWRQRKLEAEFGTEPKSARPLFVTWMYGRGDRVTAYNFPALDDLSVIRPYALNRAEISPAADSLLQSLVPDNFSRDQPE